MIFKSDSFCVRPWQKEDAESIVRYANNRNVWLNLREGFPHPYTLSDAEAFLSMVLHPEFKSVFRAIAVEDEAIGGIGVTPFDDVYFRTAEVGYWIGEPFWGRGIATSALKAITAYAFEKMNLIRIQAGVYEWNPASCRVLEKAGYHLEARQRQNVVKNGAVLDSLMYVILKNGI